MRAGQKLGLARAFRDEGTIAERALWEALRGKKLNGWKFRRQAPIDRFVTDFLCHAPKLIVELDGALHDEARDAERDRILETLGFVIVRINERVVRERISDALAWINFVGRRIEQGLPPYPDEDDETLD
ncbi:MAG: endonuclease domain-containing protein [Hyphomonadaceae bacterium]